MKKITLLFSIVILTFSSCQEENISSYEILTKEKAISILDEQRVTELVQSMGYSYSAKDAYLFEENILVISLNEVSNSSGKTEITTDGYLVSVYEGKTLVESAVITSDQNIVEIETAQFSGVIKVNQLHHEDMQYHTAELSFYKGKYMGITEVGRTESHMPILECTGRKFKVSFGFEEAACYIGFAGCFFTRWADCAMSVWSGKAPNELADNG